MNFLAHLALAERSGPSLVGNLAGDFVKGMVPGELPDGIRRGIIEHRRIDEFTDTHPVAGTFRRLIARDHGHYAKVIADIFFDHLLASRFQRLHGEPLEEFLASSYGLMDPHETDLPGRLRLVYPRMRDERWLQSYATREGIAMTLANVSRRLSRRPVLEAAMPLLDRHEEEFLELFTRFYADLRRFADSLRERRPESR